jgi:hypothetical protein
MVLENTTDKRELLVIHPLDDVPEQKIETKHLGPMRMTPAVRTDITVGTARLARAHDVARAVPRTGSGRSVRQGIRHGGGVPAKRGPKPPKGERP